MTAGQSSSASANSQSSTLDRALGAVPLLAVAFLYLVCALTFIRYPRATTEPWLDPSYEEAYAYFLKTGAQAGVDYAFTYGPLGHFIIPRFDPVLFYLDYAVILLIGLAGAVPLALWGRRHNNVLAMLALAAVITCLVPGTAGPEIGFLIAVVATTLLLLHSPNAKALVYSLSAGFFAFLSLTKFTLLVLNSAAVAVLALHLYLGRRFRTMGVLLCSYALFIAIFWVAAGQHPLNFIPYILRSLEISEAYNAGMYLPGRTIEVMLGVVLWLLLLGHLYGRRRTTHANSWSNLLPLLFVAFVMLITWKMGIVRQQGHINKFYVTVATIPFFLPYPAAQSALKAAAFRILPVLIVVLGSSGYFLAKSSSPTDQVIRAGNRLIGTLNSTFNPTAMYGNRNARLDSFQRIHAFPEIQEIVGDDTIDVFSANQALVVFNRLNYHPRPVFQGYQACTPELLHWNAQFYEGPNAPRYILYLPALTPIDDRFPTTEDAETLKSIFRHYRPRMFERGLYLLERMWTPAPPSEPIEILDDTAHLSEWIPVDGTGDHWQLLELHISPTIPGRLRTLAFKMPIIEMTVRFADDTEQTFRINIGSIETGFILNPYFGLLTDIHQWPLGADARRITAFRITTNPADHWAVHDAFRYTLRTTPPIAPVPAPAAMSAVSEN